MHSSRLVALALAGRNTVSNKNGKPLVLVSFLKNYNHKRYYSINEMKKMSEFDQQQTTTNDDGVIESTGSFVNQNGKKIFFRDWKATESSDQGNNTRCVSFFLCCLIFSSLSFNYLQKWKITAEVHPFGIVHSSSYLP